MPKSKTTDLIEQFIDEANLMGYPIKGSVFKADYNGKVWTVGFWIQMARTPEHKGTGDDYYNLPGRMGRAKDPVFRKAVKKAIERARFRESQ